MPKKIAIVHYRVCGTDGVSLEIAKRKEILESMGRSVKLIAGELSPRADYIIKDLDWDNGVIPLIKENGFYHYNKNDLNSREIKAKINEICQKIEARLNFIQLRERFDCVLVHNIFSFGGHFAAAKAFAKWIKKFKIPCLATHHDFHWDRKEFDRPKNAYLKNLIAKYMPPKSKYIRHIVINSLAQKQLKDKFDIKADLIPDIFDFKQEPWKKTDFNRDFCRNFDIRTNDLVVLQATRIHPRKGIELAIDYIEHLQKDLDLLCGRILYNKKRLNKNSRVVLLLPGYYEKENSAYYKKIKQRIKDKQIEVRFIAGNISQSNNKKNIYTLWDTYVFADLATYPSIWEGWGNQFIEAVFACKPIVMFNYPVYEADIKPEGYKTISLGKGLVKKDRDGLYALPSQNIQRAVQKSVKWLTDPATNNILEKNFQIGEKYHGYHILEKYFKNNIGL